MPSDNVGDRYISFDEEAAHELAEALVLSDNAKRFAIARSMLQMCTFEMYFRQFIISLPVIIAYSTAAFFNGKLGFIKRPFIARLPIYALSLLHGFLVYVFPTDVVTKFYEREADKDACDLGLNYMVGGAEYYTKIMQRNAAIHELSVVGEKAYSVTGNEIYPFWRSPHLLTRTRRDYIESRIQEAQQADKTSFVETAST
ncbi:unnamed protein product [Cyprideis torosa]|uniref:Uncharacterized protein n=1 Tax=Cyprideis torosa TaxID=163714 RepID=A0A7R8WRB0_9CRUS|nr:unnamed protein product [Cyprideis torosa]CAG0903632.1 unnamed protein product [Cyprideis torosa]